MSADSVLAIPLPFVTALLAGAIAVRLWTSAAGNRAGRAFFTVLLALFALQAVLVGLRFVYGLDAFIPLQRVLPLAVGPLFYLGFRTLAAPRGVPTRAVALHLGVAFAVATACLASGSIALWLDVLIAASYCAYLTLLVRMWRGGPDSFADAPFSDTTSLRVWLSRSILLLAFLLVVDTVIAVDFMLGAGRHASLLIALASLLLILGFIAAFLFWPRESLDNEAGSRSSSQADGSTADDDDRALAGRAATLLAESRLYRDPELTLSRGSRDGSECRCAPFRAQSTLSSASTSRSS